MKPEQQRIAIAEACGWTWEARKHPAACWHKGDFFTNAPLFYETRQKEDYIHDLPGYLNDLNAMHEAEEVSISQGLQDHWLDTLVEVVVGKNVHWSDYHCFPQVNRATAAQRAEAFLKTLNLWTP
jgi:hypothetical protein